LGVTGLRKIHATAIVGNAGRHGNSIEFVHTKDGSSKKYLG